MGAKKDKKGTKKGAKKGKKEEEEVEEQMVPEEVAPDGDLLLFLFIYKIYSSF